MQWIALILFIPYLYLLLKIYAGLRNIKSFKPQPVPDIFVSVIVACRNEEKNLPSFLLDIAAQDYNPEFFELIIVDDNSSDSTYQIASGFKGIKYINLLRNPEAGKKKALKKGVETCTGDLVITTDADCRMGRSWLTTIASFYSEHKPEMIICPVAMEGTIGFFQRFQELEFLSLQGITAGSAMRHNPVMCNGANLAFTKKAYQNNAGNLHEEKVSGDDVFLLHSMKRNDVNKIRWLESPEALLITGTASTFSSFLHQRARWISKAGAYFDRSSIVLAIVTFVTVLLQPLLLIAGIFDPVFLLVFLAAFVLKSIPDYMIIRNTASRYSKKRLMKWFLPSQIFYTWYILRVVPKAMFKGNRW
ncbi:MAG: glycosyltransferase [Bacteroidia bacterium]|nr:glycosyltransferase [Bacteroidia bacterium]